LNADTIVIDPQLASIIPPLTEEEHKQLEHNLLTEGCRDPIVVWNNILIDGHHRYPICTRHNIPFQVIQKDFADARQAEEWMILNQLGRRNLNSYQRVLLTLKLKDRFSAQAQSRMQVGTKLDPTQNFVGGETRAQLGELAQVSRETLRKVEFIEANASEPIRAQARRGELSVHRAYALTSGEQRQSRSLHAHHILHSTETYEWYTPAPYIEAIHEVMGHIDLDPASSPIANRIVQATRFLTLEEDGLRYSWFGRVFLNPPYGFEAGDSNQAIWTAYLLQQYQSGATKEAILLVNATPERKWFQPLWNYPVCFTDHRIRFYRPHGEAHQPTHGNAFVYLGKRDQHFINVFCRFGTVVRRVSEA
jgi:hypothetical protein